MATEVAGPRVVRPAAGRAAPRRRRHARRAVTLTVGAAVVVTLVIGMLPTSVATADSGAASIPLGEYAGAGNPAGVARFAASTGAHVTMALDYLNGSSGWSTLVGAAGVGAWSTSGYRLVLGVPMLPRRGHASLAKGARGAYDRYFVALAENLVREGEGHAVLRPGWEFNGDWFRWKVRNATAAAQYAAYFRNIVDAMRSVPGAAFTFVWNPNASSSYEGYTPAQAYPGDAYVDAIGVDLYDESWVTPLTAANAWNGYLTEPWGLDWLSSFATAQRKPVVFPEWGVAIRSDGHGLGDDASFVDRFASWITAHGVAWTAIFSFDSSQQDDITDGSFPDALAAFEANFG